MDARSYFVIIILCCLSSAKSYGQQHPPDSLQLLQPVEAVPQSTATQTGTAPVEADNTAGKENKELKQAAAKQPSNPPKKGDAPPKLAQKPPNLRSDTISRYQVSFDTCSVRVAQLKRENRALDLRADTLEDRHIKDQAQINALNDWLFALLGCSILLCSFLLWHIKKTKPKNNLPDNKVHLHRQSSEMQPFREKEAKAVLLAKNDPDKRTVYGELLMSAGPRKKHHEGGGPNPDFDLGEDVAGLLAGKDQTTFWLMDGTSDSDEIRLSDSRPFFSSRLLAQTLGWKIREVLAMGSQTNAIEVLIQATQAVQAEWQDQIKKLSDTDTQSLKSLIRQRRALYCSTTMMAGILDHSGLANIARFGDSGFVLYSEKQPYIAPAAKSDRQFASLILDAHDNIILKFSPLEEQMIQYFQSSELNALLAFSDGIGVQTVQWLSQFSKPDFAEPSIRRHLLNLQSKTGDDKSLIILQVN